MMYKQMHLLALVLSLAAISPARADDSKPLYPNMAPIEQYLSASPEVEIAMARSAAPAAVSDLEKRDVIRALVVYLDDANRGDGQDVKPRKHR